MYARATSPPPSPSSNPCLDYVILPSPFSPPMHPSQRSVLLPPPPPSLPPSTTPSFYGLLPPCNAAFIWYDYSSHLPTCPTRSPPRLPTFRLPPFFLHSLPPSLVNPGRVPLLPFSDRPHVRFFLLLFLPSSSPFPSCLPASLPGRRMPLQHAHSFKTQPRWESVISLLALLLLLSYFLRFLRPPSSSSSSTTRSTSQQHYPFPYIYVLVDLFRPSSTTSSMRAINAFPPCLARAYLFLPPLPFSVSPSSALPPPRPSTSTSSTTTTTTTPFPPCQACALYSPPPLSLPSLPATTSSSTISTPNVPVFLAYVCLLVSYYCLFPLLLLLLLHPLHHHRPAFPRSSFFYLCMRVSITISTTATTRATIHPPSSLSPSSHHHYHHTSSSNSSSDDQDGDLLKAGGFFSVTSRCRVFSSTGAWAACPNFSAKADRASGVSVSCGASAAPTPR